VLELTSRFGDGASLLTGRDPSARSDEAKASYRQRFADADFKDMLATHEERLAELEATHGTPMPVIATAKGLAESIEAALVKQLGNEGDAMRSLKGKHAGWHLTSPGERAPHARGRARPMHVASTSTAADGSSR
jgi:hypothetical protein